MFDATTIFIAAVFALAGLTKGIIGLGLPTISMGLLAIVMHLSRLRQFLPALFHHECLANGLRAVLADGRPPALADDARRLLGDMGRGGTDHRSDRQIRHLASGCGSPALRAHRSCFRAPYGNPGTGTVARADSRSRNRAYDRGDRGLCHSGRAISAGHRALKRRIDPGPGIIVHGVYAGTDGESRSCRCVEGLARRSRGRRWQWPAPGCGPARHFDCGCTRRPSAVGSLSDCCCSASI